jgi:hypothetical protein
MEIAYSREGAGAFFGLVALAVANGMSMDDAARKATEVWGRHVQAHRGQTWSVEDLVAVARDVTGA